MKAYLLVLVVGGLLSACDSSNKEQSQDTRPPQWVEQERAKMKQRSGSSNSKIPSLLDEALTPDNKQNQK
jgi:hypothetical protein